jgi:Aspartyl/Asparaginyl beta-hydroxylase
MQHVDIIDIKFDINELLVGLDQVLQICDWHEDHNQIGLTHSLDQDTAGAWYDATGSLTYAWGKDAFDENGNLRTNLRTRSEQDFTRFVQEFSHTVWQDVYNKLSHRYRLGRVRLMRSRPKSCLSWHTDNEMRLHIPLITNPGARLVIEDSANHLVADGSVYLADTTKFHTAFNAGLQPRIHLVACVLD